MEIMFLTFADVYTKATKCTDDIDITEEKNILETEWILTSLLDIMKYMRTNIIKV